MELPDNLCGFENVEELEDYVEALNEDDWITLDVASYMTGFTVEEFCTGVLSGEIPARREPKKAIRITVAEASLFEPNGRPKGSMNA